jgi:hypothetical protein
MIQLLTTIIPLLGCFLIPGSAVANYNYELYGEFNTPRCVGLSNQLFCRRFDNWLQATALLNNTPNLDEFPLINLKPNSPILLSSDLNVAIAVANQPFHYIEIHVFELKGVDTIGWSKSAGQVTLYMYASYLTFYMNNLAPSDYQCTEQLMKYFNMTFFSFFTQVLLIDSVAYDRDVAFCPYIFSNANLSLLHIGNLVDSFVVKNLFKFQRNLQNASSTINSVISQLEIRGYGFNLDETIMHPLVFESVERIGSFSSIGSIQIDLFKSFKNLSDIMITEFSLKNFFHRIGVEWTRCLNQYTVVEFNDFKSEIFRIPNWLSHSAYTYPNSDVCIFASFPLQNLVFPILDTNLTVCTDTIAWLTQTYQLYNKTFRLTGFPRLPANLLDLFKK